MVRGEGEPLVTKLHPPMADTDDMQERSYEPRTALWARAEVCWEDPAGKARLSPATLEDTSLSGACIRIASPISPGARVTVKWHREEFSAVARNCRRDGHEYLLGVRRETKKAFGRSELAGARGDQRVSAKLENPTSPASEPKSDRLSAPPKAATTATPAPAIEKVCAADLQAQLSPAQNRRVMESKSLFPKFWRRETSAGEVAEQTMVTDVPANTPADKALGGAGKVTGELLGYEDIYRAAGILRGRSGYDMNQIVEMLHCDRLRGLPDEVKHVSVLMAVEAAGASADDVLRDANARKQALEAYEAGQTRQLEDFEARKARENAELEAEMAKLTAHYRQRIQANQNQVVVEKEVLRNWQLAMQHESKRIAEVINLCAKPEPKPAQLAAAVGAASSANGSAASTGPTLLTAAVAKKVN